jgi:hypothetical protein
MPMRQLKPALPWGRVRLARRFAPAARSWPTVCALAVAVPFVVAPIAGCKPPLPPRFGAECYAQIDYPYGVQYVDREARSLMPSGWRLDNYVFDAEGNVTAEKSADEYRTAVVWDSDGDGEHEGSGEIYLYELRFEHVVDAGLVWLRTVPLGGNEEHRALRVHARNYVAEVAGGSYVAVGLQGTLRIEERRFASTVIEEGPTTVGDLEAYEITFDVADVDQLALDPEHRQRRVRIVIIRPDYTWTPGRRAVVLFETRRAPPMPRRARGDARYSFPVLMVVGYASHPDDFAEHEDDFRGLLERIRFGAAACR